MGQRRYKEISEQKEDITKPKTPEKDAKAERTRRKYSAFRDAAEEATKPRDKGGGGRTIDRKPPKGPEFR